MNKPTFRAWDKRHKVMRKVNGISYQKNGSVAHVVYPIDGTVEVLFDKFILMQSTGLKDKNGVEIFEGDVVIGENFLFPFPDNRPLPIYWDEETGGFQLHAFNKKTIEIVGNIHENPELLNEVE